MSRAAELVGIVRLARCHACSLPVGVIPEETAFTSTRVASHCRRCQTAVVLGRLVQAFRSAQVKMAVLPASISDKPVLSDAYVLHLEFIGRRCCWHFK